MLKRLSRLSPSLPFSECYIFCRRRQEIKDKQEEVTNSLLIFSFNIIHGIEQTTCFEFADQTYYNTVQYTVRSASVLHVYIHYCTAI